MLQNLCANSTSDKYTTICHTQMHRSWEEVTLLYQSKKDIWMKLVKLAILLSIFGIKALYGLASNVFLSFLS